MPSVFPRPRRRLVAGERARARAAASPSKPGVLKPRHAVALAVDVDVALERQLRRAAASRVPASDASPSLTSDVQARRRARPVRVRRRRSWPTATIRPRACRSASTMRLRAGATASPPPVSIGAGPCEREPHARRPAASAELVEAVRGAAWSPLADRRGQTASSLRPSRATVAPRRAPRRRGLARPSAPARAARPSSPSSESRTIRIATTATASTGRITRRMKKKREAVAEAHVHPAASLRGARSAARPATIALAVAGPDSCFGTASRGYSSVGRAPGSHPGGRGFESP